MIVKISRYSDLTAIAFYVLAAILTTSDIMEVGWSDVSNMVDSQYLRLMGHIHCYKEDWGCDKDLLNCHYMPVDCAMYPNVCVAGSGANFYDNPGFVQVDNNGACT